MTTLVATLAALDRYSLAAKRPITVPLLRTWLQREIPLRDPPADGRFGLADPGRRNPGAHRRPASLKTVPVLQKSHVPAGIGAVAAIFP